MKSNSEACNQFIVPLFHHRGNQIINELQAEVQHVSSKLLPEMRERCTLHRVNVYIYTGSTFQFWATDTVYLIRIDSGTGH